jgi:sirohydrochlorin cobaltochelatase
MQSDSAIVLFAHGARDARWARPLERLRAALAQARPGAQVRIAFLELQAPGLPETLAELAGAGVARIDIAPIFWSLGGHITRDLPALIASFSTSTPAVQVRVLPVLAELPGMDGFVAQAILAQATGDTVAPESSA